VKVFKDYCGVLNEDVIRKNFILLYELLDEMLDFGYPQLTSTEMLKVYIHNEPAVVSQPPSKSSSLIASITPRTMPSTASLKPIMFQRNSNASNSQKASNHRNEIFVDIFERITVLFNSDGVIINSSIDGSIQLKSYLAGNPELRLALNEDLSIGRSHGTTGSGVILDDCNFHECVRLDEFESARTLVFLPPDGEFSVLNYRITNSDFFIPFRIYPVVEDSTMSPYRLDLITNIRANIPESNNGTNVSICIPVPRTTSTCTFECNLPASISTMEYNALDKQIIWTIRKFHGGTEAVLRTKITLEQHVSIAQKRELGPISMNFDIPMYNLSNLQVRYLRIAETSKAYNPYRWVRYVTQSSSYVCRLRL